MLSLRLAYFVPVPVIRTDALIPQRFDAMSVGVAVLIRPSAAKNEALIEHELTHCRQFYRTLGIHALLYWLSAEHRLKSELEAYAVQASHRDDPPLMAYADNIVSDYGLGDLDLKAESVADELRRRVNES